MNNLSTVAAHLGSDARYPDMLGFSKVGISLLGFSGASSIVKPAILQWQLNSLQDLILKCLSLKPTKSGVLLSNKRHGAVLKFVNCLGKILDTKLSWEDRFPYTLLKKCSILYRNLVEKTWCEGY